MRYKDTTDPSTYAVMQSVVTSGELGESHLEAETLRVQILGIYQAHVGAEWSSHGKFQCDFHQYLHLVRAGEAQIRSKQKKWILRQGNFYWLPGNFPVERITAKDYAHTIIRFRFASPFGNDLLLDWPDRSPLLLGPIPTDQIEEWIRPPFGVNGYLRLQCVILHHISRAIPNLSGVVRRQVQFQARYAKILETIKNNLGANLRIEDLARIQGKSQQAFSMGFMRDFGISPKMFINRQVNEEACRLLMEENLTIKEIAARLQFSDEFYFSRFFLKMNGIRPSQYRLQKSWC